MNYVQELLNLYEKNENLVGDIVEKKQKTKNGEVDVPLVLLPVSHTTVLAQITVIIDADGNFMKAESVAKSKGLTIIPVTEKSGSRTAGTEPHPLCDNVRYVAGDFMTYYEGETGKKDKDFSENYRLYMEALKAWKDSAFTHKKVQAIYSYLKKGCLLKDLIKSNIIHLNQAGKMIESEKINGESQTKAFVRFCVLEAEEMTVDMLRDSSRYCPAECWLDKTLFQSFIQYYQSLEGGEGLSYLTGNKQAITYLHPKKIRNEGDGGKLFSANDETYFTFRGRFRNKTEAISIGYIDSQKIHNALKWIIRKQGYSWGDLTVATWESDLLSIPDCKEDTDTICDEYEGWGDSQEYEPELYDTDEAGAKRFRAAMWGYEQKFDKMSKTVLLALDSATPGRVSIAESRVLLSSNYVHNLQHWHESCSWIHTKYKEGRRYSYRGMVGIDELAKILYGTEQNGVLTLSGSTKICAELYKRLLPCLIERKTIPQDLVKLAIFRASAPTTYKQWYNWENILETACSLIKKQYYDKNTREEWNVALEKDCDKRDYLFGRLLAVAHYAEFLTYDKKETRSTNAQRYMSAFSQRPMQTWKVIDEKLYPYYEKLERGERERYQTLIDEISDKFSVETYENEKPLGGLYLLGFHSQLMDLRKYPQQHTKGEEE